MNYWTQSEINIFVAAYRGFSAKYPENTMLAYKEVIKLGVDQIQTHVRITKDNELVLIHDLKSEKHSSYSAIASTKSYITRQISHSKSSF